MFLFQGLDFLCEMWQRQKGSTVIFYHDWEHGWMIRKEEQGILEEFGTSQWSRSKLCVRNLIESEPDHQWRNLEDGSDMSIHIISTSDYVGHQWRFEIRWWIYTNSESENGWWWRFEMTTTTTTTSMMECVLSEVALCLFPRVKFDWPIVRQGRLYWKSPPPDEQGHGVYNLVQNGSNLAEYCCEELSKTGY